MTQNVFKITNFPTKFLQKTLAPLAQVKLVHSVQIIWNSSSWNMSSEVGTNHFKSGLVKSSQDRSSHFGTGQFRSNQCGTGQIKKFFGPKILLDPTNFLIKISMTQTLTKLFYTKYFLTQNSCGPNIFLDPHFLNPNFFCTNIFFKKKIFLDPKDVCIQNFFGPRIFLDPKRF